MSTRAWGAAGTSGSRDPKGKVGECGWKPSRGQPRSTPPQGELGVCTDPSVPTTPVLWPRAQVRAGRLVLGACTGVLATPHRPESWEQPPATRPGACTRVPGNPAPARTRGVYPLPAEPHPGPGPVLERGPRPAAPARGWEQRPAALRTRPGPPRAGAGGSAGRGGPRAPCPGLREAGARAGTGSRARGTPAAAQPGGGRGRGQGLGSEPGWGAALLAAARPLPGGGVGAGAGRRGGRGGRRRRFVAGRDSRQAGGARPGARRPVPSVPSGLTGARALRPARAPKPLAGRSEPRAAEQAGAAGGGWLCGGRPATPGRPAQPPGPGAAEPGPGAAASPSAPAAPAPPGRPDAGPRASPADSRTGRPRAPRPRRVQPGQQAAARRRQGAERSPRPTARACCRCVHQREHPQPALPAHLPEEHRAGVAPGGRGGRRLDPADVRRALRAGGPGGRHMQVRLRGGGGAERRHALRPLVWLRRRAREAGVQREPDQDQIRVRRVLPRRARVLHPLQHRPAPAPRAHRPLRPAPVGPAAGPAESGCQRLRHLGRPHPVPGARQVAAGPGGPVPAHVAAARQGLRVRKEVPSSGPEPAPGGGAAVQLHAPQPLRVSARGAAEDRRCLLARLSPGQTLRRQLCLLSPQLRLPLRPQQSHQEVPRGPAVETEGRRQRPAQVPHRRGPGAP